MYVVGMIGTSAAHCRMNGKRNKNILVCSMHQYLVSYSGCALILLLRVPDAST